jgi:Glutaredoxin-like domain (DUF836)
MTLVTLYTRPGCHLCDEARQVVLSVRDSGETFEFNELDIDRDDELHARFLERIPVVEIDGELVAELHLDARALRDALARSRHGTVRPMTNHGMGGRR